MASGPTSKSVAMKPAGNLKGGTVKAPKPGKKAPVSVGGVKPPSRMK